MTESVRSTDDNALDKASWKDTLKVSNGYADILQVTDVNLDDVCTTPRFPKWEVNDDLTRSCRTSPDWKRSGANKATPTARRRSAENAASTGARRRRSEEAGTSSGT